MTITAVATPDPEEPERTTPAFDSATYWRNRAERLRTEAAAAVSTGHWTVVPGSGPTFVTKDSGAREEFETGSVRDSEQGKGRYDLLPREAVHRLAGLYERGAAKYGDRNWEKGQQYSRMFSSLLRHAFQAKDGMTDEDHLAAVAWNAFALITTMERVARGELPASLNDMPWAEADE